MAQSMTAARFKATVVQKTSAWSFVVVAVSLLSFLLPHYEVSTSSVINNSVQMILCVFCIFIAKTEPTKRGKQIFINFAVMFAFSFLFHLYSFLPDQFLRLLWFQYVGAAYYLAMAGSIAFVTIDTVFRNRSIVQKYLLVLGSVGGLFLFYYYPLLVDYRHIYATPDAADFSLIQKVYDENQEGSPLSIELIAEKVVLQDRETGQLLNSGEEKSRINHLYPYLLSQNNYVILFVKPLYLNIVYMCVATLGFILLFFAYQFMKDPPQGAYLDKMMFLFLIFFTLEILHAWSYVKSVEWTSFHEIMNLGQMISIGLLLCIGAFFFLRLRFVTSPNGQFYEQEIAASPGSITRWRDTLDDLIVTHFINNSKRHVGRIFVDKNQVS